MGAPIESNKKRQQYSLPLDVNQATDSVQVDKVPFPEYLLIRNVWWFCQLRWGVVASLAFFALVTRIPAFCQVTGLLPQGYWPLYLSIVLAISNHLFLRNARTLTVPGASLAARRNLWMQIFIDLLVVTIVVHQVGSLESSIAFAYLFHVVLACIFFTRFNSLMITTFAALLFLCLIIIEYVGKLPAAPLFQGHVHWIHSQHFDTLYSFNVIWTITSFYVIWFLVSQISALLQDRNAELFLMNQKLLNIQKEKAGHMLRTTHELKAPFAAVHANLQLLLKGYCGDLPEDAMETVQRSSARCQRLSNMIKEMLQLANLHSETEEEVQELLQLDEILQWCVEHTQQVADERKITTVTDLPPVQIMGNQDHLKMLFTNIIFNAINYSENEGQVRVSLFNSNQQVIVEVEDQGIGIAGDKLPKIFDEYFRTETAVKHNQDSTGLGLSIVCGVVRKYQLELTVESEVNMGTLFRIEFPTKN